MIFRYGLCLRSVLRSSSSATGAGGRAPRAGPRRRAAPSAAPRGVGAVLQGYNMQRRTCWWPSHNNQGRLESNGSVRRLGCRRNTHVMVHVWSPRLANRACSCPVVTPCLEALNGYWRAMNATHTSYSTLKGSRSRGVGSSPGAAND